MKRATALKSLKKIVDRIHAVNGLLATPEASSEAFRIKRAWVFGSTVKGSESPGDLDILIDAESVGRRLATHRPWLLPRPRDIDPRP